MKFKIRFADQIVGVFSLFALAALLALIFAIGASQNWFVKKNYYHSLVFTNVIDFLFSKKVN